MTRSAAAPAHGLPETTTSTARPASAIVACASLSASVGIEDAASVMRPAEPCF